MIKQAILLCSLALITLGCATHRSIKDPLSAIAVADQACREAFRAGGGAYDVDPKTWRAKLVGDHWEAWTEGDDKGLYIDIPRDGRPINGSESCATRKIASPLPPYMWPKPPN
jgi:hypothetical protein